MINITKAIIHILNPEQGITIQSRNELDITSGTTYQYVNSLIEKAFNVSQLKFGNFASNSTVLSLIRQYKNNESEFGEISRTISEKMYESLSATEKSKDRIPSDVIFAEFIKDEVKYIAILKCENKVEYLHKVINSGEEVTVEIADINSILPPKTKVVTECAFIDLEKEAKVIFADFITSNAGTFSAHTSETKSKKKFNGGMTFGVGSEKPEADNENSPYGDYFKSLKK